MNSVSDLVQQSNPYAQFIDQLVMLESQKKYQLEDRKDTFSGQQSALSNVSSVITDFTSKIEELNSSSADSFSPLASSTSDEEVVRVDSISGQNQPNNYDITVHNRASKDIMLTDVVDGNASTLAAQGDGSVDITIGDKTETINVATTKTDDAGNTVDMTNEEILQSFSDSVNELMGEAADTDVFQIDGNGDVQLSIKSAETGFDNRIQFSNASGALAEVTGNMTHHTDPGSLDAEFTIDGITFTRGQNTVDNAISGLTFTLLDDTGTKEQISVTKDLDTAKENINGFISAFNEMNTSIRSNTFINGETGDKGPLQGMRSIRNLSINLRQMGLTNMASAADGEINNLADIGIGFENSGKMKIEDSDLLEEALSDRPEQVKSLFSNEDSPIANMQRQAEMYTQSNGIISSLESGLDQKLDRLDNRIESEERYLEKYEERQRQIFAEVQQIQTEGQRQYSEVMNFQSTLGL